MPARRSIRMKPRSRTTSSKRASKSARTAWWRSTPGIAAIACAMAAIIVILVQSPHASNGARKADVMVARDVAAEPMSSSPDTTTTVPASAPLPPSVTAAPQPDANVARVTIEGCLERADDAFRLTNTAGTSAPTTRSWKSAFLKKRSATIEVRDSVKRVNLASHVGQRVSVTGTLVDREMRVGSLQRIAPTCSASSKVKI